MLPMVYIIIAGGLAKGIGLKMSDQFHLCSNSYQGSGIFCS
jgi:hypothetical protein